MSAPNGHWTDFIADFMVLSEGQPSPELWRRWAGVSLVAGALERRCWAMVGQKTTFPNLYTLLVGPPGTGKWCIEEARELWRQTCEPGSKIPAFRVAPNNMTKASLFDRIAKSKSTRLPPSGPPVTYHSLLVAAEEFGVLMPDYDQSYIHSLNYVFNNPPRYDEDRRTGSVKELLIEYPQLNILGGVQPSYLASTFPEEAWSTGLARRIIMVYAPEPPDQELFYDPPMPEGARERVLAKLSQISALHGQFRWEPAAVARLESWHASRASHQPTHSKLAHYTRSRGLHAVKLAMVSAVARTGHLVIALDDVERAIAWLLEAERLMPDIFREMIGKSDSQIIEELHYFVTSIWAKDKSRPVHSRLIWNFLAQRIPSDKIERIVAVAERANIICRVGGTQDLYMPRPRHEHGVE